MTPEEVDRFLRAHSWGVLCTVGDGRPYAVPVSYAFDGARFYVATGPGRKARHLERCPAVCLTVAEVADGERWTSVVATGEARWVEDLRSRMSALRLLARRRPGGFTAKDLARAAQARVLSFAPDELTGRTRGRGDAPA